MNGGPVSKERLKLLVLGASGACGQWVTRLAAERGHAVTVVLRPESPYRPPGGVAVVPGDVTDASLLAPLLGPPDVVLSCLGLRRRSIVPWSALRSPPDLVERVSTLIGGLPAAEALRRFIWISAGGVGESREAVSRAVRLMIDAGHVGTAYRDLERAESVLARSPVRSLAVRPVTLTHGPPSGRVGPVRRYGLLSTVRRSDVATWMLDVADGTLAYAEGDVLLGRP